MKSSSRPQQPKQKSKTMESKLQRIERQLAQITPETKHIQLSSTSLTTSLLNSTPQVVVLNTCSQGSSETTRNGDKIRNKKIMLKVHFGSASSLGSATMVQAMLIREKTTLGSALSPTQFFDSSTPTPMTWLRNVTTRDPSRFIVLWDSKPKVLGAVQAANATNNINQADPNLICCEIEMPLNFVTDLSRGNAGTVSDIDTDGLNLVIFTANTVASAVYCSYAYTLDFTDA